MSQQTQVVINFEGVPDSQTIAARLRMQADILEGVSPKEAAKGKKALAEAAKKKAKSKDAEEEQEEFEIDDDEGAEAEEEETEEEETEEEETEEEEAEEEEEPELKLDSVMDAFKKFAKKKGNDKARAILTKFKVKAVKDLKKADWPKAMKMLGA